MRLSWGLSTRLDNCNVLIISCQQCQHPKKTLRLMKCTTYIEKGTAWPRSPRPLEKDGNPFTDYFNPENSFSAQSRHRFLLSFSAEKNTLFALADITE